MSLAQSWDHCRQKGLEWFMTKVTGKERGKEGSLSFVLCPGNDYCWK
jgi:hypothetical protein